MASTLTHPHSKDLPDHEEDIRKPHEGTPKYDQFGSFTKFDPKEIALVRKLDLYMMVCHPIAVQDDILLMVSSPRCG